MTNIEERLRAELQRSGSEQAVVAAPSIDEMGVVAKGRQQRNRAAMFVGAIALAGAALLGFVAAGDSSTVEVASVEGDAEQDAEVEQASPTEIESSGADAVGSEQSLAQQDAGVVPAGEANAAQVDEPAEPAAQGNVGQENEADAIVVERRESAVPIAGVSGVLVAPTNAGGYVGLATRFGGDSLVVGLSSDDGLDWVEVEVSGVPNGATASKLTAFDGTFVGLFESFSPDEGKQTFVGTSSDLAAWEVAAPLAGELFPVGIAAGEAGVIVLGDQGGIWTGPIGGPYAQMPSLPAQTVSGVTTIGGEFLVAGRSVEGAVLYRSPNGTDWTAAALSSPVLPGSTPVVLVDEGTIVLSNATDGGDVSLVSVDGGATWEQIGVSSQSVSVNSDTLGVLSLSNGEAAVALSDFDSTVVGEIDISSAGRLSLVAAGDDELVLIETTESGTNWIVARR